MKLKKLFFILAITNAFLIVFFSWSLISYQEEEKIARQKHEQRYDSMLLADELRQSSDDLTRLARTYVVTADDKYEDYYWQVLAIRNGDEARPEKYSRIYWDYIAAGERPPRGTDDAISLQELMLQAGFTKQEFSLLRESQRNSDGLVKLETEAMHAVKGLFKDASGEYTVRGRPDLKLAQELLHSEKYHTYKANIMEPIDRFLTVLDERTLAEVKEHEKLRTYFSGLTDISMLLFIAALICSFLIVFLRIIRSVDSLSNVFDALANGKLDVEIPDTERRDEIGDMAKSATNFQIAMQSSTDENWVKSHVAELSKKIQNAKDLQEAASSSLNYLMPLVNGGYSAFYKLDIEGIDQKPELQLFATYANSKRKNLANRFEFGEGLVGQCALEKKPIILSNAPADYSKITSGTGEALPLNISVYPLIFEENLVGVVEISSFIEFSSAQEKLLESSLKMIALYFDNLNKKLATEELLLHSQMQAEELKASEEELRASNDELQHQSSKLEAKTAELQTSEEELKANNEALQFKSDALEKQYHQMDIARNELQVNTDKLQKANQYKSEFLANMSHELRTPLNSILILAKNLATNPSENLNTSEVESASIIHDSGSQLLSLINDILDISKSESGAMEILFEPVPIQDISMSVERFFRHVAQENNLEFNVKLANNLPDTIKTDWSKLDQILNNLLANAFKFTEKGGVNVSFDLTEGKTLSPTSHLANENVLAISVTDTGIGIPADKIDQIFEAFKQADGSTSRKYGGTGLGLTITKKLAELLGGGIVVESEPDKGTQFTLYLPLEIDESLIPAVQDELLINDMNLTPQPKEQPINKDDVVEVDAKVIDDDRDDFDTSDSLILVIENTHELADVLYQQVKKRGFKCVVCGTGKQGIAFAQTYQPYGILLNADNQELDAKSVLENLKSSVKTRNIPVTMISDKNTNSESPKEDMKDFLSRPISTHQIDNALQLIDSFANGKQQRVLVVEDDKASHIAITQTIKNDNVVVSCVDNAEDALELIKSPNPQIENRFEVKSF